MRKTILTIAAGLFALPLLAAEVPGFVHYSAASLKAKEAELAPKVAQSPAKNAFETLDTWGNHFTMLASRTADGEAELHVVYADMFIVEAGAAELVVGGKIVSPRNTGEGEVRGKSIEGGERVSLKLGDIVHIPANTPHQLLVKKNFTYFVIKVKQ